MRMLCVSALLFLFVSAATLADSDDVHPLTGLWVGVADAESGPMRFDLQLSHEDASLTGEFVLISEGGMRLAAEQVEFKDGALKLVTMQGAISVLGTLDGDEISGSLHTPTGELSMRMARADSPAAEAMIGKLQQAVDTLRSQPFKLLRSGPGMETIDRGALNELVAAAEASFSTALALMHDGELVGEWYRGDEAEAIETMSVTKVALNLIIGRLLTLGVLDSVDAPVHRYYPQWAEDEVRASITIRQLMAHTSGVDRGQPAGPIYRSGDFVQFALDAPLEAEPGSQVIYSNNATNLLGGIIGQLLEQPLEQFLAEDLFGELGIDSFAWHPDPAGNPQGMAGLALTAVDLAKFGQLALDRGRWQGKQLIDADWFEQSFTPGSEHSNHVGLIWFLSHDEEGRLLGASHSGYLGQWLGIRFDERIVGARQVRQSPAYNPDTDVFQGFVQLLPGLAPGNLSDVSEHGED